MGQYYKPVLLEDYSDTPFLSFYSHDYGNGSKLMEHSWVGNDFVAVVESRLANSPKREKYSLIVASVVLTKPQTVTWRPYLM